MKSLINERDLDRIETEAEALVKKMEEDFLITFLGNRRDRDVRGRQKEGKEAEGEQRNARLLE